MSDAASPGIGALVEASEAGDPAARNELFAALYSELHRVARSHLARSDAPITLSATTLLHEAYLDISRREHVAFLERNRFLAYASRAMRGLVIDHIRSRRAQKRGAELTFLPLDDAHPDIAGNESKTFDQLDVALRELEELDPALAQLVDLKFFCGFSFSEVAAMRGISERTVQRDWNKARVLLQRALETLE
jgi:RNA polymerase sigma factor (TIGR02999 family)